jgi:hypothetical protein
LQSREEIESALKFLKIIKAASADSIAAELALNWWTKRGFLAGLED